MWSLAALALVLGTAIAVCGLVMIAGRNVLRSVAGVMIAYSGVAVVLGYLGLGAALAAVIAVGLGYTILGAAVAVRTFEEYSAIEADVLNAADDAAESPPS